MRSTPVIAAGILLIVGGLIGLGMTYREMKHQRHLHDKLTGVRLDLSKTGPQATERFTVLREGLHTIHIATLVSAGAAPSSPFSGMVEYGIVDTAGRIRYLGRVLPGMVGALVSDSATLLTLDTVYIPEAGAVLQLQARVLAPDSAFARTISEIFLMPPMDPGFGDDLRRQSMFMAAMGLTIVIGFCIIVFGGRARRSP